MSAPITAFSLKMYFTLARTGEYCATIAQALRERPHLADQAQLAIFPSFIAIPDAVRAFDGVPVKIGAQDVCEIESGARTGEVSILDIRDSGCELVEIGHAERRQIYGETDSMVAAKTRLTIDAGLIPLLCIGEAERTDPGRTAELCAQQALDATGGATEAPVWLGYEPYWAIGAPEPAPSDYIREVCDRLRESLSESLPNASILYGGSAGPGLAGTLGDSIDGLFLGRFAHDPARYIDVVEELIAR